MNSQNLGRTPYAVFLAVREHFAFAINITTKTRVVYGNSPGVRGTTKCINYTEGTSSYPVCELEFIYLAFSRMPGENYRRLFGSSFFVSFFLLCVCVCVCVCVVFRTLINSLVCLLILHGRCGPCSVFVFCFCLFCF